MSGFKVEKIAERFDEEIRFFKSWVESPKAMGTICPTGKVIATRMASVINTGSGLPVLELGPGTGAITKAILRHGVKPENLYSVEYTASLIPHLEAEHPGVNFIHGDAFDLQNALERSPLGLSFANHPGEVQRYLATELAFVWQQFCERLAQVPVVRAIESGEVTVEDYRQLLLNLRQQVIEGGRWIAHIAASMGQELFLVRSTMIRHAAEEHRDYQMLERNYVAAGGKLEEIVSAPKNVGSEAFSAYMFHNALQPNPLNMFGAMFIIEGLGQAKAGRWAEQIKEHTGLGDDAVSFLAYHGENDDDHYEKLRTILSAPFITGPVAERIVKTARTVGRLYCLQLEELGNV